MTYKPCRFNIFCHISRYIRRKEWRKMSRPLGVIAWNSNKAIIKHFGNGKY